MHRSCVRRALALRENASHIAEQTHCLCQTAVGCVHSEYIFVREMTWVLKDTRVTRRVSRIKNSNTHFHGFVEFETPHPESWRAVVAHKECTLETTVVEGCVFHELTFSRKMPNAIVAESM